MNLYAHTANGQHAHIVRSANGKPGNRALCGYVARQWHTVATVWAGGVPVCPRCQRNMTKRTSISMGAGCAPEGE